MISSLLLIAADSPYTGRIQGGWEYIWVSYGITWAALALYALFLWFRRVPHSENPPKSSEQGR